MSRTNHNILYFAGISRTCLLNTAICLWKLTNSLTWRGIMRSELAYQSGQNQEGWSALYASVSG